MAHQLIISIVISIHVSNCTITDIILSAAATAAAILW
jgi:hypothetical protein